MQLLREKQLPSKDSASKLAVIFSETYMRVAKLEKALSGFCATQSFQI
jgi:hypothetical protein